MERREAEAVYDAGREVVVEVLLRMDRQIQTLTSRVERLERELAKNSRNSSRPPSSDPPAAKERRKAARPKGPSGKSQGAQPGHEGHGRELLPMWAVDEVVTHWPVRCGCGHAFGGGEQVTVGEPVRHQVEELPQISTIVVEHQCPRVRCPDCGKAARAPLPVEATASALGPRLVSPTYGMRALARGMIKRNPQKTDSVKPRQVQTVSSPTAGLAPASATKPCANTTSNAR